MLLQTVTTKIGNMRKAQKFVIYPGQTNILKIQSDDCIALLEVATNECRWVRNKGGAYNLHLTIGGNLGGGVETLSPELTQQFVDAQAKKGQEIGRVGSGVIVG